MELRDLINIVENNETYNIEKVYAALPENAKKAIDEIHNYLKSSFQEYKNEEEKLSGVIPYFTETFYANEPFDVSNIAHGIAVRISDNYAYYEIKDLAGPAGDEDEQAEREYDARNDISYDIEREVTDILNINDIN